MCQVFYLIMVGPFEKIYTVRIEQKKKIKQNYNRKHLATKQNLPNSLFLIKFEFQVTEFDYNKL